MHQEKSDLIFWGLFKYSVGGIVARRFVSTSMKRAPGAKKPWGKFQVLPGESMERFETLAEARAFFATLGLTCYDRVVGEPRHLLECYV